VIPLQADDADDPTRALPVATIGIVILNLIVFLYELSLSDPALNTFINAWSLVPCEFTNQWQAYPGTPTPFWLTLVSSMFPHAGWDHILGNMLFLVVFGIHVERAMGPVRYIAFYLVCGMGANAAEILTSAGSNVPGLGASGAISGVLAAYLLLYPASRVRSLIPLGFIYKVASIPAWVFIGLWFVLQLVESVTSFSDVSGSGVAYSAHVGGFITGLLLVRLFTQPARVGPMQAYHAQWS
jgi:membrane associated rhomboid family serine protease